MKAHTLDVAISEAKRFLEKARLCKKTECKHEFGSHFDGKEAAAVKRSSMDLTRALADMRLNR